MAYTMILIYPRSPMKKLVKKYEEREHYIRGLPYTFNDIVAPSEEQIVDKINELVETFNRLTPKKGKK
mgnify:CR=1 FL=1